MHRRNKKTDRLLLVCGLLVSLGVGLLAWLDMRADVLPAAQKTREINQSFLVLDQDGFSSVPPGNDPVIVQAGGFRTDGNDPVFVSSNIAPIGLPQREISLVFKMEAIPARLSPVFNTISEKIKAWKLAGNIMGQIFIDHKPQGSPDFQAMKALSSGLRSHLERNFWVVFVLDLRHLQASPETRTALGNIEKDTAFYVLESRDLMQKHGSLPAAVLAFDKEYRMPFQVITDDPALASGSFLEEVKEATYFSGFIHRIKKDRQ